MRQVVDPAFKHSSVVSRIDQTNSSARSFVENLKTFAIRDTNLEDTDKFTVHAATAFMKFPFYFTAEAVYGTMSDEEKDKLWVLAEKRLALLPWFFKGGVYRTAYLKFWDRPAYNQLMKFVKDWSDFNGHLANMRRKQNRDVPIVSYWREYEKGNISMEQVIIQSQQLRSSLLTKTRSPIPLMRCSSRILM